MLDQYPKTVIGLVLGKSLKVVICMNNVPLAARYSITHKDNNIEQAWYPLTMCLE